jgi:hypothetical protein
MIRICSLGALLVTLTAISAFAQEFTEDFEGGIPASWSMVDNHLVNPLPPAFSAVFWTTNDLEGMLNYTNGGGATGAGTAATASSFNHSGQYDVSLITPPFHVTAGDMLFRYTINYQPVDAFEAFDTNLSINGGPWVVMTHDTDFTGPLGPAYSTGPPKVIRGIGLGFFGVTPADSLRVEFRYYTTFLLPMVHNEYVQIDDVRFPTEPVPEPAALTAALMAAAFAWAANRRSVRVA